MKTAELINETPTNAKPILAAVKCKWCQTLACNKKATNWINANTKMYDGTEQQVGYCYGHYIRSLTNSR